MDKEEYQPITDYGGKRMFAVQKTKNKEEYKVWVNIYHSRNPERKTFNEIDDEGNEYRYTPTYEGELIARYKTRKEAIERARRLNNGIPLKERYNGIKDLPPAPKPRGKAVPKPRGKAVPKPASVPEPPIPPVEQMAQPSSLQELIKPFKILYYFPLVQKKLVIIDGANKYYRFDSLEDGINKLLELLNKPNSFKLIADIIEDQIHKRLMTYDFTKYEYVRDHTKEEYRADLDELKRLVIKYTSQEQPKRPKPPPPKPRGKAVPKPVDDPLQILIDKFKPYVEQEDKYKDNERFMNKYEYLKREIEKVNPQAKTYVADVRYLTSVFNEMVKIAEEPVPEPRVARGSRQSLEDILGVEKDYYKVLGLEPTATADEIKKAYRKLALKYHPDKRHKYGTQIFQTIQTAYAVLGDEELKRNYDKARTQPARAKREAERYHDPNADEAQVRMFVNLVFSLHRPREEVFTFIYQLGYNELKLIYEFLQDKIIGNKKIPRPDYFKSMVGLIKTRITATMPKEEKKKRKEAKAKAKTGAGEREDINQYVKSSYDKKGKDKIGNAKLDKELSNKKVKIYHDDKTGKTTAVHRGTTGTISDWSNNAVYALTGNKGYKKTDRYKVSKDTQKKAIAKYGKVDETIGHSQGGIITRNLSDEGLTNKVINVNPASRGEKVRKNEKVYRSSSDLVSILTPKDKKVETIKAKKWYNPLSEHSSKILKH